MGLFKHRRRAMAGIAITTMLAAGFATAQASAASWPVTTSGTHVVGSTLDVRSTFGPRSSSGNYIYDTELYDSNNRRVAQYFVTRWTNRGESTTISYQLDTRNLRAGTTYRFKQGVFTSNWNRKLAWNNSAGYLTLRAATTTSTTASTATSTSTSTSTTTTTTTPTSTTTSAVPTTTSTSSTLAPAPSDNLPGWNLIFTDNFDTNASEGSFLNTYGSKWNAYPNGWRDTSKKGNYNPGILSANNGIMNMRLHTNSAGVPQVAAPEPRINGAGNDYNQLYGRYEVRFRADEVDGYKTAWLLWPKSEVWPRDGEIDFPEGDLTGSINAFMHRQGGTSGGDQDWFGAPGSRYNDWHTAIIEWAPDSTRFILDDVVLGTSTSRIPNTPMRYVLQTETELNSTYPARTAVANVQVDYVKVYSYAP